jgi:hypothetical protein
MKFYLEKKSKNIYYKFKTRIYYENFIKYTF